MPKAWDIERWDICQYLHAMNDMGGDGHGGFGRSHTYTAECYAQSEGIPCKRKGQCIKARIIKENKE